ncbi:pirin family protein [Tahibacter harae]|uniref:Pirin family protein n=1 Tax=Tahibacter harae TaxID=2963937 RepID=A0ABT1QP28_9GAMM|nr:pirin family protein [Tahibacter harae]MCQ4163815.1 pirin family protein [Tahibacter harae]
MMQLRKSEERGRAEHGWLSSRHTFSFAEYRDPRHMGFGPLRVINEDRVAGGQGFGTHGHQDMEIISYVLAGALEHKDSLGTGSVLRPGDVQRMSAGHGVRHSEFNHSPDETVHFLQIWIFPDRNGHAPSYEEKHFTDAEKRGRLRLLVSPDGRDGSLRMNQQAFLLAGLFDGTENAEHPLASGRRGYVHVARGEIEVNGQTLKAGDALSIEGESSIRLGNGKAAEVLVFDLP